MTKSIMEKLSLKGQVAIITGTTKGIGRSLAEALAEAGADVAAIDRSDNDYMAKYCKKLGVKFKRIKIDLLNTSKAELEAAVSEIVKEFSRIDILVNNAGITRRGKVEDFTEKDWQDVLSVNLNVPFYLSQAVSKFFIKQKKGKIINIASMLSYQGGVNVPSYVTSKHALVGMTRSLAVGLAHYNINVNAIAPGFIKTDMTLPLQQDKDRNSFILKRIPLGRWGEADDLKGALILLASSASDFINGEIIVVDGGWLIR